MLICAGALFSGCSSIMVFQEAKTVPQGQLETGAGVAAGSYSTLRTLSSFNLTMPSVAGNVWLRYGLLRSMDFGVNAAIPGAITADAKYMFLAERDGAPLTMSLGLGYGFPVGDSDPADDQVQKVTDYISSLYVSRDVGDVTLYVSPRYFYRRTYNEIRHTNALPDTEVLYDDMWGVGLGVAYNVTQHFKLMVECQHEAPFKDGSFSSDQCGGGISTRWGSTEEK